MDSLNWKDGTWQAPGAGRPAARITIAGDWAPIRGFSESVRTTPEFVYGDLLPVLRNSGLRMVNLECPLVDEGLPVCKSGAVLKGVSAHIQGLTAVPFEIATLGNNHVFDYGIDAFVQTRSLLAENGIRFTGAGLSLDEAFKPLRTAVNGVDIAVVSFSEGEDLTAAGDGRPGVAGWEVDRVVDSVRRMRPSVHAIIVVCHAGVEYIPFPPPYLADALQRIAEAGADLVIAHHPHVPQGVQIHRGVPICYSLGNFVFFQPTDLLHRKIGYLVEAGLSTGGLTGIRIVPYMIGADCLGLLKGEALQRFFKKLKALSDPLSRENGIRHAWHGFLRYYGINGFKNEMASILDRIDDDPPKGAAMFRNRLTTLQHFHHLKDLMTSIMDGTLNDAPAWALDSVGEYFTRRVWQGLPE